MSLSVTRLNSDSTFLLTFSPVVEQSQNDSLALPSPPPTGPVSAGSFTILLDPWLDGVSKLLHPKVYSARHLTQPSIESLSQLPEPNVVIVSQGQTDHCHEETLRQLDPTSPITTILAESAAAKRIRKMKHFRPDMVHTLRPFSKKNPDSVIRFCIPPIVLGGTSGEVTITFIEPKRDLSGIHNAIGVTYVPPSTISKFEGFNDTPLLQAPFATTALPMTPPDTPTRDSSSLLPSTPASSSQLSNPFPNSLHSQQPSSVSSISQGSVRAETKPRCFSMIYSPHGLPFEYVHAYATSHLVKMAALPLSLLLHPLTRSTNPWYLGGNVITGAPGGLQIANELHAKCWMSAHDGDKEVSGFTTSQLVVQKFTMENVAEQLRRNTELANLGSGGSLLLKP